MSKEIILFKKDLSDWLIIRFKKCFNVNIINAEISSTNNEKFGDFQSNVSLSNSKIRIIPRDISNKIIDTKNVPAFVEKIEIAGPGFINFTIKNNSISNNLEFLIKDNFLGVNQIGKNKNIIIDYSSPNVAKPMHIGHIRSTVIGNALDRLYRFQGYNVIADNHLGDWGTQFGLMIIGFREYVDNKALNISPIDELERIYVKSYNRSKDDNEWKQLAKELVKLQQGDKIIQIME